MIINDYKNVFYPVFSINLNKTIVQHLTEKDK